MLCRVLLIIATAFVSVCTPDCPASGQPEEPDLPVVHVDADDTVIDRSCRIVIEPGAVIADVAGDGVIRITASDIIIEFAHGSVLRGGPADADPDTFAGIGIRLEGVQNVTLRNVHIEGFKAGIWATGANGLTIEDSRADNLWRHRLRSTPAAEVSSDWLWPHRNDDNEWLTNYGAAFYIEDSDGVTVRRCVVRRGQNGLVLDRVNEARIFDNDLSFLSGWGLAMWRSSRNIISRNALDFCVRGYSHGVYNRGQDSAGILMFEQCSENIIAENSATHGGDGFFGFAGREAMGEAPPPTEEFDYTRRGCNDNLLIGNDFSHAPAHGIEMTFSFGNRFIGNRLVGNAICGIWGGYSQETTIEANEIAGNGLPGRYEGGGINIEHGRGNIIRHNTFRDNTVAVAFWWDSDEGIFKTPWARANHKGSVDNRILANSFEGNTTDIRLRKTTGTELIANTAAAGELRIDADADSPVHTTDGDADPNGAPVYPVFGETRPVGARQQLRGRENIIMGPWGPWDHQEPMVRFGGSEGRLRTYEMYGGEGPSWEATDLLTGEKNAWPVSPSAASPLKLTIVASQDVHPYAFRLSNGDWSTEVRGTIFSANWTARFFSWTEETDPRTNLAGWRALADAPEAVTISDLPELRLRYAHRGPRDQPWAREHRDRLPGSDRFGMIATAAVTLPRGVYQLSTVSDDGVRVMITRPGRADEPQTIIDNWTWHAPTRDTGRFRQSQEGLVIIQVEHFEIDGYAILELDIERVEDEPDEPPTPEPAE